MYRGPKSLIAHTTSMHDCGVHFFKILLILKKHTPSASYLGKRWQLAVKKGQTKRKISSNS